jgi:putative flippase GtrA
MTLADWKDIATILGIAIALLTYLTNSYFQFRNKRIENLKRYFDAYEKLFDANGFIMSNLKELEEGTYKRNTEDREAENIPM